MGLRPAKLHEKLPLWRRCPPGTDETAMDFRRLLPEIRWQSRLSPGSGTGSPVWFFDSFPDPRTRWRAGWFSTLSAPALILQSVSSPARYKYILSLPERAVRSLGALSGGLLREIGNVDRKSVVYGMRVDHG